MKWIGYAIILALGVLFVGWEYLLFIAIGIVVMVFLMTLFPKFFGL